MSKIIKKILNFQKRKNGNISILVLIMSMAIILLTTAMVGYIFHDIGFTELDKGELRALHFAESGLSNMYYKIDQYYKNGVALPPESPPELVSYTEDIGDPDPEGRFTVEYTIDKGGVGDRYTITSTGVDISSGVTRKVKVETTYINIGDAISCGRASGAAQLTGQIKITGPFIVDNIGGPLLGKTSFWKGPLIVNGDITMKGASSIGEEFPYLHEDGETYGPITLVLGGVLYSNGDPVENPLSPPTGSNIYVEEYIHEAFDITLPPIDDSYINLVKKSGPLEIGSSSEKIDLFIGKFKGNNVIMVRRGWGRWQPLVGGEAYLKFNDDGILVIKGNIIVYGDINIGGSLSGREPMTKYTIEYSGNANLISTGSINVKSKVIPKNNLADFPKTDLMALISLNNINLDLDNAKKEGTYKNPDVAVMLIADKEVNLTTNTFLRGGTVSNILHLDTNTEIYYQTGIGEALTAGIPGFGDVIKLQPKWQEE